MKKLGIILLIILVGLAVWMIVKTDRITDEPIVNPEEGSGGASGQFMKLGSNSIVVLEQRLTDYVVVNALNIEKSGFVVIYRDRDGAAGDIIGVSKWFAAGQYADERVSLTEALDEGMTYYAELRVDDGNGVFEPKKDGEVNSSYGAIRGTFEASATAADPSSVQIYY